MKKKNTGKKIKAKTTKPSQSKPKNLKANPKVSKQPKTPMKTQSKATKSVKKASVPTKHITTSSVPASLGEKRGCLKCSTKFYDFGKSHVQCPKCKTEFDINQLLKKPKLVSSPVKVAKTEPVRKAATDEADGFVTEEPTYDDFGELDDDADVTEVDVTDDDDADEY